LIENQQEEAKDFAIKEPVFNIDESIRNDAKQQLSMLG